MAFGGGTGVDNTIKIFTFAFIESCKTIFFFKTPVGNYSVYKHVQEGNSPHCVVWSKNA